jgi:sRNA-binding regulator protein Hfq
MTTEQQQQTENNFFNTFKKETVKVNKKDYDNMVYKHILINLKIDKI